MGGAAGGGGGAEGEGLPELRVERSLNVGMDVITAPTLTTHAAAACQCATARHGLSSRRSRLLSPSLAALAFSRLLSPLSLSLAFSRLLSPSPLLAPPAHRFPPEFKP